MKKTDAGYIDTYYAADGSITATPNKDTDRFVLGHANPDFTFGWNNSVNYKIGTSTCSAMQHLVLSV